MGSAVVQKLLTADAASAIIQQGRDQVTGIVTLAGDVADLRTPAELLRAFGVSHASDSPVYVVRFTVPPGAELSAPVDDRTERPWPRFPTGFLHQRLTPVWFLSRTRYPYGAELWKINPDGSEDFVMPHLGAARGWDRAPQWAPPSVLIGTRARWQGQEYAADVLPDGSVQLTALTQEDVPGWERARPSAIVKAVSAAEVEQLFEYRAMTSYRDVPARIISQDDNDTHLQFEPGHFDALLEMGARMTDIDVFEAVVQTQSLPQPEYYMAAQERS